MSNPNENYILSKPVEEIHEKTPYVAGDKHASRSAETKNAILLAQMALAAEDLVAATAPDRNWKGIIIAVLVIGSVCALIVTSVVLLTPPDEGPRVKGRRLELQDIFGPEFQPYRLNGTWISDNEWIYRDPSGGISVLDVSNSSTRILVSNHTFRRFNAASFSLSSDLTYVLFTHDVQKVHRVSFTAKYTLFEIATGDSNPISVEPLSANGEEKHSTLQLAKWAPSGQGLILVQNGDIYYRANPKDMTTQRITRSGQPGVVYNGIPDWIYEEEIFGSNSALWFSSDGQNLLYLTFNDSLVGEHHMLEYGPVDNPYIYPRIKSSRYPKPGTNNPTVKASAVNLRTGTALKSMELIPPEGISNVEHYIVAAGWIRQTHMVLIWTARSYNLSIISMCPATNGICEEVYRITADKRGWVESTQFPIFTKNGDSKNFITIAPIRDGENGFFDHLIFVDIVHRRSHPVTHGNYDVVKINAWDEENKVVYFTAIPSTQPGQRRLYRVKMEQPFTEHSPDCLLCEEINNASAPSRNGRTTKPPKTKGGKEEHHAPKQVGQKQIQESKKDPAKLVNTQRTVGGSDSRTVLMNNKSCSFVTNMKFSPARSYFVLECSGPQIPFVAMYSTTPDDNSTFNSSTENQTDNLRLISVLQSNDALVQLSNKVAYPQTRTFAVHLMAGHTVQVRLLLPPGLREDEITKYPLVLNVYGGPGTQLAIERWGVDFSTYLASKKDYIVAQIDGRGSGGRGWDFQHKVYYKLGELEVLDQIEVVRHLRDSLHFVDQKKIGVWGWSFGGYLTAMIMTSKDSTDLFHCGASIAPVSNWKLYDSAYTERYMGKPNISDNYKGYADSDVTRNVDELSSKMFYLVHGTADDNVHIQHSMLLAKALIQKKILFRQQVYPDEPHGLNGAKVHVHKSIELFFEDCFRKQTPKELGTGLNKGGKFEDYE